MQLLITGSAQEAEEIKSKFGDSHNYIHLNDHSWTDAQLSEGDVLFDFRPDSGKSEYGRILGSGKLMIMVNSSLHSLNSLLDGETGNSGRVAGFNGLPSFIDREILEVSCYDENSSALEELCHSLGTDFCLVDDRVGLVTPRVICMIINEAYYTLQEGTAQKEAIDQAMKLGTNYPYGPFEWADRIGLKNVHDLLQAVFADTGDERYKVCPLLKKEVNLS